MVQEIWQSAFELKWWPLDLAIAWVLTRDRIFVERQWKGSGDGLRGISVELAMDRHSGHPLKLEFPGVDRAWTELKSRLEDGSISIVGSPFRRVADMAGGAKETSGSQREIADTEISSLILHEERDDLCLIPEDWRVARGSNRHNLCGYRTVRIRAGEVLHFFQPSKVLALPSENLGHPRNPLRPGWMPISDAAYWIASEGGRISFSLCNLEKWQQAFFLLLPLMSSGQISAVGRRHGRGLPEPVPNVCFAGIAVAYPYSDSPMELLLCERPHLQCYGIVDNEHWEETFNDCLMGDDRHTPEYSHLQARNSDIAREFPFSPTMTMSGIKTTPAGLQEKTREVAARLWPEGNRPARVKERNAAIIADFERNGETPPSPKTIFRALKASRPEDI